MDVSDEKARKRSRRHCGHCDSEVSHSAYYKHKRQHFVNGVWERESERVRRRGTVKDPLSSRGNTGRAKGKHPVNDPPSDSDETADDQSFHVYDVDAMNGIPPLSDPPTDDDETADDRSVHLEFIESGTEVDDETDIHCFVDEAVTNEDQEGETLAEEQSDIYPNMQEGEGHGDAQSTKLKMLSTISRLSRKVAQLEQKLDQCLAASDVREQRLQSRIAFLEAKLNVFPGEYQYVGFNRIRRVQRPKIAESVRKLHNAIENTMRYVPEQGLASAHNKAVTDYLVETLIANPDLEHVEYDIILSACKTHYETIRRNFRYSQPHFAHQVAAMKTYSRRRQRRLRLLLARRKVLAPDEVDFWKDVTIDMMSDEDDATIDGVSGYIVRRPSFRSQELDDLCAALQTRLEADEKYTTTHRKRLQIGQPSDRMPPNKYDPEAAKRHLKPDLLPELLASSVQ